MKTLIILLSILSFNLSAQEFVYDFEQKDYIKNAINNIPSWDKKTINRIKTYGPLIIKTANLLKLDPQLVLSIAWTESHFNPKAISSVGALGIMQVKDDTKYYIFKKNKKDLNKIYTSLMLEYYNIDYKIIENIIAGTLYIKYLLSKFKDKQKAIVAYNEGLTGTIRLINKNYNLNKHNYYAKINNHFVAMNY